MELAARWPLATHHDVRDELLATYGAPGRGYHDQQHLAEVLDHLTVLDCDATEVELGAWFHDAVYDGRAGAEERSAQWAQRVLPAPAADEVARLARLTEQHQPGPDDTAGRALCDADLAILAAPPQRYAAYVRGVREEYAHVPDDAFAHGRAAILRSLVDRPWLFHTPRGRELWEKHARANVAAELARLTGGE